MTSKCFSIISKMGVSCPFLPSPLGGKRNLAWGSRDRSVGMRGPGLPGCRRQRFSPSTPDMSTEIYYAAQCAGHAGTRPSLSRSAVCPPCTRITILSKVPSRLVERRQIYTSGHCRTQRSARESLLLFLWNTKAASQPVSKPPPERGIPETPDGYR